MFSLTVNIFFPYKQRFVIFVSFPYKQWFIISKHFSVFHILHFGKEGKQKILITYLENFIDNWKFYSLEFLKLKILNAEGLVFINLNSLFLCYHCIASCFN